MELLSNRSGPWSSSFGDGATSFSFAARFRASASADVPTWRVCGATDNCVASGLTSRARLSSLPPEDDFWLFWNVRGDQLPEECHDAIHSSSSSSPSPASPAWFSVKWWLFAAPPVFPRAALRMEALFAAAAFVPFLIGIVAWKLLADDTGAAALIRRVTEGVVLVLLSAVISFAVGVIASEATSDRRENTIVTAMVLFPLLMIAPLIWSTLRAGRLREQTVGATSRYCGVVLLSAAIVVSGGRAWFGIHENIRRVCPTCMDPVTTTWLELTDQLR